MSLLQGLCTICANSFRAPLGMGAGRTPKAVSLGSLYGSMSLEGFLKKELQTTNTSILGCGLRGPRKRWIPKILFCVWWFASVSGPCVPAFRAAKKSHGALLGVVRWARNCSYKRSREVHERLWRVFHVIICCNLQAAPLERGFVPEVQQMLLGTCSLSSAADI